MDEIMRKLFFLFGILAVSAYSAALEIPVPNGDFETPPADIKNPSWKPETVERVADAFSGKYSMKIKGGARFGRIAVPPEAVGKYVTLSFHAKGIGRLRVNCEYFSDKKYSGGGKEVTISLFPEYRNESVKFSVPVPAETKMLDLLFSADLSDYIMGEAFIDDLKITVDSDAPPAADSKKVDKPDFESVKSGKMKGYSAEAFPADFAESVNVAPYAKLRTTPFVPDARRLADGDVRSGITFPKNSVESFDKYVEVEAVFPSPAVVSAIRFTLPSADSRFLADCDGDGKYETILAENSGDKAFPLWGAPFYVWREIRLEKPVKVSAVKMITGKDIHLFELQIMSPKADAAAFQIPLKAVAEAPLLQSKQEITPQKATLKQRYRLGFTVEPWMFGSQSYFPQFAKTGKMPPLAEWKEWQNMVKEYKELNANLIHLFPPKAFGMPLPEGVKQRGTYFHPVIWPSKVWYASQPNDILRELTDSAHKEDLEVFVINREWIFKKDYEGDPQVDLAKEIAERGVDAVALAVDEEAHHMYRASHYLLKTTEGAPKVEPGKEDDAFNRLLKNFKVKFDRTEAFKKRWPGAVIPDEPRDSEDYRKFLIFMAEEWAGKMRKMADAAKQVNPDVRTCVFLSTTDTFQARTKWVSEHDTQGYLGGVDIMGNDPYFVTYSPHGVCTAPYYAQMLRASTPTREAAVTLNPNWALVFGGGKEKNPLLDPVYDEVCFIGGPLTSIFNGAHTVNFWRYNFMHIHKESREYIRKAFSMADTLAAWGGKTASTPKETVLIRSRASEDFWQIRSAYNPKGRISRNAKGYYNVQWLTSFLMGNAYPFETYFQDHIAMHEKELLKYRVMILAFPYSISTEELAVIRNAVDSGVKVIAFGAKGEVDGIGNAYGKPVLEDLINDGKVIYFDADIASSGNFPETGRAFDALLDKAVGEKRTMRIDSSGKNIHSAVLEVSSDEKLILLVNWTQADAEVVLDLNMPSSAFAFAGFGKYGIECREPEKTYAMEMNGKDRFTADELRNFKVKLPYPDGAVKILRIYKK